MLFLCKTDRLGKLTDPSLDITLEVERQKQQDCGVHVQTLRLYVQLLHKFLHTYGMYRA